VTLGTVRSDTLVWHEGWSRSGSAGRGTQHASRGGRREAGVTAFWIRFLARVIDSILLGVVNAIVRLPLMLMFGIGAWAACAVWAERRRRFLHRRFWGVIGLSALIG
jgi:hypothetical protein